jgi:cytochrome c oxidase accessory protein FixG
MSLTTLVEQAAAEATLPPAEGIERADVEAVNVGRGSIFEKRRKIYPQRVHGSFRTFKWFVMAVTLGIYYITPWIRWDRGPGVPNQAVLIDFPARKFYFFFIEIWPQEVIYGAGLMILAAFGLFLVTSTLGRAWCGYTCPQTVWTDLFLVVERLFEGRRNERIKLDRAGWSAAKLARKAGKHVTWLVIAVATGGAWVFYFADAPTLASDIIHLEAPVTAYFFIGLFAFTTYALGGLMREQVCTYMCPWPRIQAAMMDAESLAVTYRFDRGEPRGPHKKGDSWENRGDCIDCHQCVVVCPTGVDIRNGAQLACINCALCIDACNSIMDKVGRPRGLIGYDTDANIARRQAGEQSVYRPIRARTIAYTVLIALIGSLMLYSMTHRTLLDVSIRPDRSPLYVLLSDGRIQNGYTFNVLNKRHEEGRFQIDVMDMNGLAEVAAIGADETERNEPVITVEPDELRQIRLIVRLPRSAVTGQSMPLSFQIRDLTHGETILEKTKFQGPE